MDKSESPKKKEIQNKENFNKQNFSKSLLKELNKIKGDLDGAKTSKNYSPIINDIDKAVKKVVKKTINR